MTALIISVGGTPDAIAASIVFHKPDFVCFFASQESVDSIAEIKKTVNEAGVRFKDRKVVIDNPADLVSCYKEALKCIRTLDRKTYSKEDIIVDYTGGTKPMAAALCLATVNLGLQFSYVSGKLRDKNGLGVVVKGTEDIKKGFSPWRVLLVEEKQRFAQYFNSYQFDAALNMLDDISSHDVDSNELNLVEILRETTRAYQAWDNFNHGEAARFLKTAEMELGRYIKYAAAGLLAEFKERVSENKKFLDSFLNATKNLKILHIIYAEDLLSNAHRRAEMGKFDDAVARLYRAIEMIGQIEFERQFHCPTGKVDIEKLPPKFKSGLTKKDNLQKNESVELSLHLAFTALEEAGNEKARMYFANLDEIKKILHARNNSILAHGINPLKEVTFNKFYRLVIDKFGLRDTVEFPKLEL